MKVLVTGSEGFLGRHVCVALEERGHAVVGLDTVPSAEIVADITKVLPMMNLDAVIHLAALSHPRQCDADPAKAFSVNVGGTSNVLKMVLESGAKKVVFASSAHVYDIPSRYFPADEVHPLRLNNTYTTTKIMGEELCRLYWENHGLSYTTLRLFNAYGPGQGLGYFIPDMIEKAKQGGIHLEAWNTTKDWIYAEDVARAFVLAVESSFVGPINIGSGVETELHKIAIRITDELHAQYSPYGKPGGTRMQADNSRAKRVLGWEPTVSIWEGLHAVLSASKARSLV